MNAVNADAHFRLLSEGGCFPVENIARFALTGADRVRYLNGQVSNDVRKIAPNEAIAACVLSAKGRLDGVVWIWAEADRLVLECDADLSDSLFMRLERYIVADDVEIAPLPATPTTHVFGAASASFPTARKISRLNVPGVDVEGGGPGNLPVAAADDIERLRIENLVPRWGAELGPDSLPAEAGLDQVAVDFHKGCYIGQEVVSRVRSVGHANRALRAFDVRAGRVPAPGTEFFLSEGDERHAAVVTSIHLSARVGLCYIRRGTPEEATLTTPDGASRIQLRPPIRSHE